jgi:hypothetical protein
MEAPYENAAQEEVTPAQRLALVLQQVRQVFVEGNSASCILLEPWGPIRSLVLKRFAF